MLSKEFIYKYPFPLSKKDDEYVVRDTYTSVEIQYINRRKDNPC